MHYQVTEIFQSIQGEGLHTGLPCNFIRLAGCPVKCSFCDTDKETKDTLSIENILHQISPMLDHVVLTGGEPTAQIIKPLCEALHRRGYKIHIETSGWGVVTHADVDFIALSPKPNTIASVMADLTSHVDEVKWLVPLFNLEDIIWTLADVHWLQPVNYPQVVDKENLKACLKLLREAEVPKDKSLRLSVQLHKLIGVR